jgi:hypothetical protein
MRSLYKEGSAMPTQTTLDLRGEGLRTLWKRLPGDCRKGAVALFSKLIARAAQNHHRKKGSKP